MSNLHRDREVGLETWWSEGCVSLGFRTEVLPRVRINRTTGGWQVEEGPTTYPTLRTALHVALTSLVPALAAGLDGEETDRDR